MSIKVMVVDDDDKGRKLVSDLLQFKGIDVVEARNGTEALEFVSGDMSLCILDIRLPDMDGRVVAREIKKRFPSLPLVAYTASVLEEEKKEFAKTGVFNSVLFKPINLNDFDAIVREYIPAQPHAVRR